MIWSQKVHVETQVSQIQNPEKGRHILSIVTLCDVLTSSVLNRWFREVTIPFANILNLCENNIIIVTIPLTELWYTYIIYTYYMYVFILRLGFLSSLH